MAETRRVEPLSVDWRRFSWASGCFDTARRARTPEVAGEIALSHHLVLVTLAGGARELEVANECGHRFRGEDFAGAVSFVPAGCARRLHMYDVQARWASITLRPDLLDPEHFTRDLTVPSFTNEHDPFTAALLGALADQSELEPAYFEAMATALVHHLACKHGQPRELPQRRLPAWRMRRLRDYVEANLGRPIRVLELAQLVGMSVGHFHRSLLATTGQTPLTFVTARRMERAREQLLAGQTVLAVSQSLGFASPSHFAHLFKRMIGVTPATFRGRARAVDLT